MDPVKTEEYYGKNTIGFKAFSKRNALYSKNLASYTLVWSTRCLYTHYAKYRTVQKALDTTGNMLKIEGQVTFAPPSLTSHIHHVKWHCGHKYIFGSANHK